MADQEWAEAILSQDAIDDITVFRGGPIIVGGRLFFLTTMRFEDKHETPVMTTIFYHRLLWWMDFFNKLSNLSYF